MIPTFSLSTAVHLFEHGVCRAAKIVNIDDSTHVTLNVSGWDSGSGMDHERTAPMTQEGNVAYDNTGLVEDTFHFVSECPRSL